MTREEIVALFARRADALSRLDAAALAGDCSPDCVVESPFAGSPAIGPEAIRSVNSTFFAAFRDLVFHQEQLIPGVDEAALLLRATGTHTGEFMGVSPTGRSVKFRMAVFYELRDGLIVRERRVYDFTGLLIQVGALRVKPS